MSAKNSVQRGSEKEEDGSLILQSILDQILCNFSTTQVAFHWLRNTHPLSLPEVWSSRRQEYLKKNKN